MHTIDTTLDLTSKIIDVEDLTNRIEDLEQSIDEADMAELKALLAIINELEGGDYQWRGDWYPSHLINEDYFTSYDMDMLFDCGYFPPDWRKDFPHWIVIDKDKTAKNMLVDYSAIEINKFTFYYR